MKKLLVGLALFSFFSPISSEEPSFNLQMESEKTPPRHPMWRAPHRPKQEALEALSEETMEHLKKDLEEVSINLKDPVFSHGVISTDQGGIITAANIRIQAQKISYFNKIENGVAVKKVVAEGDILLERGDGIFVGSKLEYDFISHTGTLWDGRTCTDFWFLGGDEIFLESDGSFTVTNAFLTTVEGQDNWWELKSSKLGISSNNLLSAKNIDAL